MRNHDNSAGMAGMILGVTVVAPAAAAPSDPAPDDAATAQAHAGHGARRRRVASLHSASC